MGAGTAGLSTAGVRRAALDASARAPVRAVGAGQRVARIALVYRAFSLSAMAVFWLAPMLWFVLMLGRGHATALMAATVLAMPACLFALRLPDAWFRPRAWELDGRVYEWLGIRQFNWLVMDGNGENRRIRRICPEYRRYATAAGLRQLERGTRPAEIVHWTLLLASLPPLVFAVVIGELPYVAYFGLGNILVNLYPIGLQRALRARASALGRRRHA